MLDKSDLSQIRKIVREEVENEAKTLKSDLRHEMKLSRMEIQNDFSELKDRVKNVEINVTKVHKEVKETRKDLKKDIKKVTEFLDKENMQTRKRVIRIEHHLSLPNDTI